MILGTFKISLSDYVFIELKYLNLYSTILLQSYAINKNDIVFEIP